MGLLSEPFLGISIWFFVWQIGKNTWDIMPVNELWFKWQLTAFIHRKWRIYDINSQFRAIQIFAEYQMPNLKGKKIVMSTCHLTVTDWFFSSLDRNWSLRCIVCTQLLHSGNYSVQSCAVYKIISQRILLFHVWRYLMKKINWFFLALGSFRAYCTEHRT